MKQSALLNRAFYINYNLFWWTKICTYFNFVPKYGKDLRFKSTSAATHIRLLSNYVIFFYVRSENEKRP